MKKTLCAFSLVEVTLAIGILSFALVAVIGLLPVGLQSLKNATEQSGAASVLNTMVNALQQATAPDPNSPDQFLTRVPFASGHKGEITFQRQNSAGVAGTTYEWNELSLEGTENPAFKRLSARLVIAELPTATTPGRATASVAWSATSNPTWNASTQKWEKAEGFLTSAILFFPK